MSENEWNGKSVYYVTSNLEESSKIGHARYVMMRALEDQAEVYRLRAAEALVEILEMPGLTAEDISFGYWECPESPTESCIYNVTEDPMEDFCLFCGDPRERK